MYGSAVLAAPSIGRGDTDVEDTVATASGWGACPSLFGFRFDVAFGGVVVGGAGAEDIEQAIPDCVLLPMNSVTCVFCSILKAVPGYS